MAKASNPFSNFLGDEAMDASEGEESAQREESDNSVEDEESEKNEAFKLPVTTIRRISNAYFKGEKSDDKCRAIIDQYSNDENETDYTKGAFPEELCEPFKEANITCLIYKRVKTIAHELETLWKPEERTKNTIASTVIFLITNRDNIYCLTYGDAHNVVRGFEDTKFAKQVAKYATDKNIKGYSQRKLRGVNYAVTCFHRSPIIPDRLQVNGVVTSIQGRVSDTIFTSTDALKLDTNVGVRVQVSNSGVRFYKSFTIEEMCKVIEELDDEEMSKKGDGSDILDYIVEEKKRDTIEKLEVMMFERLLQHKLDDPPPYDITYKNYETHLEGKDFLLFLPHKTKFPVAKQLESFANVAECVRNYVKKIVLKKLKLTFVHNDKPVNRIFTQCLQGKIKHQGDEYSIDAGKWKKGDEIVKDENLKNDLDEILVECILIDMKRSTRDLKSMRFNFFFDAEENKVTQFLIGRKDKTTNNVRNYRDALRKLKIHLTKHLKISFETDEKTISDTMLNYFHGEVVLDSRIRLGAVFSRIYHKVDGKWFRYDQKFNKSLKDSFSSLVVQKFKDGTKDDIHLLEVWPPFCREDYYSRLYSKPKYDDCYFVGDAIKPHDVELFDIMKVLDDEIYLYHVKLDFGCITRVACSQIRNSASAINSSRHGGGEENYLEKYYELVTTYDRNEDFRITERRRLSKVKKEVFLKWFQTKRIVFVYAFAYKVEPDKKEGSVREEKYLKSYLEKGNSAGFSKSNIAKHDLHHTNVYLEELGFEFAICQISRSESNEQADEVKSEESE